MTTEQPIRPSWLFWLRLPLYTALGVIGLLMNPFGVGDITDQATQDAFYRVIAPDYDVRARDDIVVVLVDERTIEQLYERHAIGANEWPLQYADHGAILERILAFGPRALFVDVYFKKERSTDDSLPRMLGRLEGATAGTPLLFAAGYPDETLSPIQQRLAAVGTLTVDGWQGFNSAYPLRVGGKETVAHALYRIACLGDMPLAGCVRPPAEAVAEGAALSVRWGSAPAPATFPEYVRTVCAAPLVGLSGVGREILSGLLTGLTGDEPSDRRVRCPYHRTLFAHEVVHIARSGTDVERRRLAEALKDKVVLYGVALEGLHDSVVSPVHERLPGVMLHAMALDNLMTFGAHYTRGADALLDWLNYGAWFSVVLVLCTVLYLVEVRAWQGRTADKPGRAHPRKLVYTVGLGWVVLVSLLLFLAFDYEPVNSLGFLGIGVFVGELVHGGTGERVIGLFLRYRGCVRDRRGPVCWFKCLWSVCKGGAKHAQTTSD